MSRRPRVVVAKLGLDGHDVGINLVSRSLVQNGFEVIYLGKRVSTESIVSAAISEDVDAVGVSCLSGGLGYFASRTVEALRAAGADIPVLAGGIDEPSEIAQMLKSGVRHHFGPGTPISAIVAAFRDAVEDLPSPGPEPAPSRTRR
jgi:methylmalonyl-CoA mutase, C-terminal domain